MDKSLSKKIISIIILVLGFIFLPSIFANIVISIFPKINNEIASVIGNIIITGILIVYFKDILVKDFKVLKKDVKSNLKIAFKYWAIGMCVLFASNIVINLLIFPGNIAENESLVRETIINFPIYSGFSMILLAPLSEELVFRTGFKKFINNKWIFVLTSGLVFGFLHIITDLSPITKIVYLIPYSSIGIAFALMNYKCKNTYPSIIMHIIHNALTFSLLVSLL